MRRASGTAPFDLPGLTVPTAAGRIQLIQTRGKRSGFAGAGLTPAVRGSTEAHAAGAICVHRARKGSPSGARACAVPPRWCAATESGYRRTGRRACPFIAAGVFELGGVSRRDTAVVSRQTDHFPAWHWHVSCQLIVRRCDPAPGNRSHVTLPIRPADGGAGQEYFGL